MARMMVINSLRERHKGASRPSYASFGGIMSGCAVTLTPCGSGKKQIL
jgi:hypothetical protein